MNNDDTSIPTADQISLSGSPSRHSDPQGPVPALSPPAGGRSPTRPSTSAVCALVMRKLGTRAARVFLHLVEGLAPGEGRRFDNAGPSLMAVSVDCLTRERVGADGAEFFKVVLRYCLYTGVESRPSVMGLVFQRIHRPIGPKIFRQQSIGRIAVNPEERQSGALGMERYQRRPGLLGFVIAEDVAKLLDCG